MIKKLTIVIGLLCGALPAHAQSWSEIGCDEAFLAVSPPVKCHINSATRGGADGVKAIGSDYTTLGSIGGAAFNVFLVWPVGDGTFIKGYSTADAQRAIKAHNDVTRDRATDWGELRGFGDVTYMTFKVGNRACVGFDQAGPLFEYGYAWRIVGYACVAKVDNPEVFVKTVLGALRIGPPSANKNALGGPVLPFAWPPGNA